MKGNVSAFVPDGMDPDDDPDELGVTGSVRFTLQLNSKDAVLMPHHPKGPTIRIVEPFDVQLDSNGDLSHRGKKFVKLPALDQWTNPQVARYRVELLICGCAAIVWCCARWRSLLCRTLWWIWRTSSRFRVRLLLVCAGREG
ncbi:hypothetical protein GS532_21265 [Rhodococcus hoagii]|nr:hypothetical protein [Prescottella equi]